MAVSFSTARKDRYLLVIADIAALFTALVLALFLRYDGELTGTLFSLHLVPFGVITAFSVLVYFIAGLYESRALYDMRRIAARLINSEIAAAIFAVLLFYLYPNPVITPKTTLTVYIICAFFIVFLERWLYARLILPRRSPRSALLIADGREADELFSSAAALHRIGLSFVERLSPNEAAVAGRLESIIRGRNPSLIVLDNGHPAASKILPILYEFIFSKKRFIDVQSLYEEVFERVPLSLVRYEWFLEHATSYRSLVYEIVRRTAEIVLSVVILVPTLVITPFVWLAMKLEDGGPLFYTQERIGRYDKPVLVRKFRSMQRNEQGVWLAESDNRVTRVGRFLRKTRIDEFPTVFAVLRGDLSLIGPRADIVGLWERLKAELPFYSVRTLVAPGLSGWAQIKQDKVPQSVEETRERLSYDLYYVKNRSLALDLAIALRTIAILLSRKGM